MNLSDCIQYDDGFFCVCVYVCLLVFWVTETSFFIHFVCIDVSLCVSVFSNHHSSKWCHSTRYCYCLGSISISPLSFSFSLFFSLPLSFNVCKVLYPFLFLLFHIARYSIQGFLHLPYALHILLYGHTQTHTNGKRKVHNSKISIYLGIYLSMKWFYAFYFLLLLLLLLFVFSCWMASLGYGQILKKKAHIWRTNGWTKGWGIF